MLCLQICNYPSYIHEYRIWLQYWLLVRNVVVQSNEAILDQWISINALFVTLLAFPTRQLLLTHVFQVFLVHKEILNRLSTNLYLQVLLVIFFFELNPLSKGFHALPICELLRHTIRFRCWNLRSDWTPKLLVELLCNTVFLVSEVLCNVLLLMESVGFLV